MQDHKERLRRSLERAAKIRYIQEGKKNIAAQKAYERPAYHIAGRKEKKDV